jgi:hypothetical protein
LKILHDINIRHVGTNRRDPKLNKDFINIKKVKKKR